MSPLSLRRTDEVLPPPPSSPRAPRAIVALGDLLTTRKGGPVARFPAPPAMPRVPVYARTAPSRIRDLLGRRDPMEIALASIGVGLGLGVALGLAGVTGTLALRASQRRRRFARDFALTLRAQLAALIRR